MDKTVAHCVEWAEYDLGTAKAMLDTGRYLYVGYMCQQAPEKLLKAIIAQQNKENLAPFGRTFRPRNIPLFLGYNWGKPKLA